MSLRSVEFAGHDERGPAEVVGLDQEFGIAYAIGQREDTARTAKVTSPETMWYWPLPRSATNGPRASSTCSQHWVRSSALVVKERACALSRRAGAIFHRKPRHLIGGVIANVWVHDFPHRISLKA